MQARASCSISLSLFLFFSLSLVLSHSLFLPLELNFFSLHRLPFFRARFSPGLGARARFSWSERGARARVQPAGHGCIHVARDRSPHQRWRGADGWHVAHYVICPLDQSTCGAHFFPASERKKGRTKKCASGITPVAADQSPYVKRHFLWAPPRAHPLPRSSLFNSFSLPRGRPLGLCDKN